MREFSLSWHSPGPVQRYLLPYPETILAFGKMPPCADGPGKSFQRRILGMAFPPWFS